MFDQTGLDQADPSDQVSSPIIKASIGPQGLDDCSSSDDSDIEFENFPTLPNCAPDGVKSHEALWQCRVPLDQDSSLDFQPISVQKRSRIIHLTDYFWSFLLPATLKHPVCFCFASLDQTENSSGRKENSKSSINGEIPEDLQSDWSTPLRFFFLIWLFELFKKLATSTNLYAQY